MTRFTLIFGLIVTFGMVRVAGAEEKVPLPASQTPTQVIASMDDSGRLVLRHNAFAYEPEQVTTKVEGKEVKVTSYKLIVREHIQRLDPREVRAYDAHGKEVDAKDLPTLLKRETLALYVSGDKLDPLHLRLIKEGTLIFVGPPPKVGPPPPVDPPRPALVRPVPGLAYLLKKQGYVSIPTERLETGYLAVRVRVEGKELLLLLNTGAPNTHLDRYRVRHLGLEWDEDEWCGLRGLEIGDVKVGPLKVFAARDMSDVNRALKAAGDPPVDGLLGMDILRQYAAVVDEPGAALYLRKRDPKETLGGKDDEKKQGPG